MKSRHLAFIGTRPHAFSVGNVANYTGRVAIETLVAARWLAALSTPAAEGLVQRSVEGRCGRKWNQDALIALAKTFCREIRVSLEATRARNDVCNLGS